MTRHTNFAQIFTVFGNYLLDGDCVRTNDSHFSYEVCRQVRRRALTDAFAATVRL